MKLGPSAIVAQALGYKPDGIPAAEIGRCAFCGQDIQVGDLHAPFEAKPDFMDDLSLAARGSSMTCGHCSPLLTANGLRKSGHGVFSAEGTMPFSKWQDIASALREPPAPPFVAVRATARNQHMAWRAPVNYSRDLFYVRVGLRDLKIRRPILLQAVEDCQAIGVYMGIEPTAKSLAHPFASLDPDLKEADHGLLRTLGVKGAPSLEEASKAYPQAYDLLINLSLGETWALRFLLTPNAGQ